MRTLGSRWRSDGRRFTAALVIASMGVLAIGAPPAVAARPVTVSAWLGYRCVNGSAPNLAKLVVALRDANGELKSRRTVSADAGGYWEACFDAVVEAADTVRLTKGTTSRSLKLPRITAVANRVTDVVRGRGPVDGSLTISVSSFTDARDATEVVGLDGTYSHDFAGDFDLVGCGMAVVTWRSPAADSVVRSVGVPCLTVRVGRWGWEQVWGFTRPLGDVEVTLRDGSDTLKARAYAGGDAGGGSFSTTFGDDDDGDMIRALAGDKVDATGIASDASFTIPAIAIVTTLATDVVSGSCMPDSFVTVEAWPLEGDGWGYSEGFTNGLGKFSSDLTPMIDLVAGDQVQVTCRFATGDGVSRLVTAK